MDDRLQKLLEAAKQMKDGNFHIAVDIDGSDEVAQLAKILQDLGKLVDRKFEEINRLTSVTEKINSGIVLDEVLNYTFEAFRDIIPYNRIGFALLEDDGALLKARWARADYNDFLITQGYSCRMEGSSLQFIIETGKPRIINDLEQYMHDHPNSDSTKRVVQEGIKSSLTCPLIAMNKPIGFIFFSSCEKNTYQEAHVEIFQQIAGHLSVIAEKSRMYERMIELNDLKNKFLGIAAHDLRSPLAVIHSNADLLKEGFFGDITQDQSGMIDSIRHSCQNLICLIDELLDVSALESGKLDLKIQRVELGEFFNHCYVVNHHLARSKQIQLHLSLSNDLKEADFDRNRINQVLNNFISNAVKFSHPETMITVTVEKVDDMLQVAVTDEGQGISKDNFDKLFHFFSKADVLPTEGEASTGLGLAIAKKFIEAHGGAVWVNSEVGVGTTFYFKIPLVSSKREQ